MRRALLASLILLALPAAAGAQTIHDCSEEPFRRFDFWVGTWDVYNRRGALAGTNTISKVFADCALLEEWTSSSPHRGSSYNFYDPSTERWYQTWVDNGGNPLRLEGGLDAEGSMVLQSAPGSMPLHRITWTPLDGGAVRQHWEISTDGGATWSTSFDGRYQPQGTPPPAAPSG